MNITEICQLLDQAKKCGVYEMELEGMKFCLSRPGRPGDVSIPINQPGPDTTTPFIATQNPSELAPQELGDIFKQVSSLDQMSEEEILYAATPYGAELTARREEHQKKINEEMGLNK
jgi:hypothetical protein